MDWGFGGQALFPQTCRNILPGLPVALMLKASPHDLIGATRPPPRQGPAQRRRH